MKTKQMPTKRLDVEMPKVQYKMSVASKKYIEIIKHRKLSWKEFLLILITERHPIESD